MIYQMTIFFQVLKKTEMMIRKLGIKGIAAFAEESPDSFGNDAG